MGNTVQWDERETLKIGCDDPEHGDEERMAWFDCNSHANNLTPAIAVGWAEQRSDRTSDWLCQRLPSSASMHAVT
jgi:hypothetical protein